MIRKPPSPETPKSLFTGVSPFEHYNTYSIFAILHTTLLDLYGSYELERPQRSMRRGQRQPATQLRPAPSQRTRMQSVLMFYRELSIRYKVRHKSFHSADSTPTFSTHFFRVSFRCSFPAHCLPLPWLSAGHGTLDRHQFLDEASCRRHDDGSSSRSWGNLSHSGRHWHIRKPSNAQSWILAFESE